jgi:hypothetical protein
MAKRVKFKKRKKKGGDTSFNFGFNVATKKSRRKSGRSGS